jgi:hypothetical protein
MGLPFLFDQNAKNYPSAKQIKTNESGTQTLQKWRRSINTV